MRRKVHFLHKLMPACAFALVSFIGITSPSAFTQELDYAPFPGNVYFNLSYGGMFYTPNLDNAVGNIGMLMLGATVQRNFVVRSDTVAPNGVGEPILAGRLAAAFMPPLNFPGELNLIYYLGRRPAVPYISAGIAVILFEDPQALNLGSISGWERAIPTVEPYYALGVGFDMHPYFTAEIKWWHAWKNSSVIARIGDDFKEWIVNVDVVAFTLGIPL